MYTPEYLFMVAVIYVNLYPRTIYLELTECRVESFNVWSSNNLGSISNRYKIIKW